MPDRKYYPFADVAGADAVVVHCSDPRFQEAFKNFVKDELKIEHPAYIVVPGSVSSVGLELVMPKHLKTLKDQVEFMLAHAQQPRLVLINHEDCAMYGRLQELLMQKVNIPQRQLEDLKKAVEIFRRYIPALNNIEIYLARLDKGMPANSRVYFEKIA